MKFVLAFLFISANAFAHTHMSFEGNLKNSAAPCTLHIEDIYYINNIETSENLRADVFVSLTDDHGHHHKLNILHSDEFNFTVKKGSRDHLFVGIAQNQKDQINILEKNNSTGLLEELDFYAIKWWHVNHYHSAQCVNLKRVE